MSEWGNLYTGRVYVRMPWGMCEREPCEVKHLSSMRKRNQSRRKSGRDSLSSGERTGKSIAMYSLSSFHMGSEYKAYQPKPLLCFQNRKMEIPSLLALQ